MALFGSERDADLVNKLNRELIIDIIDTEVEYYVLALDHMKTNLYDESKDKVYYQPIRIPVLYARDDQVFQGDDFGQDYNQSATFGFIRDVLLDANLVPAVGDIIKWDEDYYEIDGLVENKYFLGKKPETWPGSTSHGMSVSIIAQTHKTRASRLNLVEIRSGITPPNEQNINKDYI